VVLSPKTATMHYSKEDRVRQVMQTGQVCIQLPAVMCFLTNTSILAMPMRVCALFHSKKIKGEF